MEREETTSEVEIKDVQLTELLRLITSGVKSMPLSLLGVLLGSLEVLPKAPAPWVG